MSILCEPRYRGTLLRRTIVSVGTLDGVPLHELGDKALEAAVRSRPEGPLGHARVVGRTGPNNITLGPVDMLIPSFVKSMISMRDTDGCEVAADDELVVVLRLGDEVPHGITGWTVAVNRYLKEQAGLNVAPLVRRAVVCAVLHYDGDVVDAQGVRINQHHRNKDALSFQRVDEMVQALRNRGLEDVRVRSEPQVDRDICFYTFSRHVVGVQRSSSIHKFNHEFNWTSRKTQPGPGRPGIFTLVSRLRTILKYSRSNSSRGYQFNTPMPFIGGHCGPICQRDLNRHSY